MKLSDFDYDLPEERIALRPVRPRSAARLLVVRGGDAPFDDRSVADLPNVLNPGDLLVFNDTAVIAARLHGVRKRDASETAGATIEATLIARRAPDVWRALARPGKRLATGDRIVFSSRRAEAASLTAEVLAKVDGGAVDLRFGLAGEALDAAVATVGDAPLPPYIATRRPADAHDDADYQTIFAKTPGAVAAPTASLHFDAALLDALDARGVRRVEATLHVGAGTFLPIKTDDVTEHQMHAETGALSQAAADAIARAKAEGRRVIPVGTTALRLIEAAAEANNGEIAPWTGDTDLYIRPGRRFLVADGLMTNFHLPRSTLLVLVAALMGRKRILDAYAHAVATGYRFFSYGDASLLLPDR